MFIKLYSSQDGSVNFILIENKSFYVLNNICQNQSEPIVIYFHYFAFN